MDNGTKKRRGRRRKIIEGTLVDRMDNTKLIAHKQESGKIVTRVMERKKKTEVVEQMPLLSRMNRLDSSISDMKKAILVVVTSWCLGNVCTALSNMHGHGFQSIKRGGILMLGGTLR